MAEGAVDVVAALEGFDGAEVLLADGTRLSPRRRRRRDRLPARPRAARGAQRRRALGERARALLAVGLGIPAA